MANPKLKPIVPVQRAADPLDRFILKSARGLKIDDSKAVGPNLLDKVVPDRGGIHARVRPSHELGAIVGNDKLPRSQVISKVWDYIKSNNLQNPANKREILADDKLKKVFGKDKVTMFEMNKHIANHVKA